MSPEEKKQKSVKSGFSVKNSRNPGTRKKGVKEDGKKNPKGNDTSRLILAWVGIFVVAFYVLKIIDNKDAASEIKLTYSQFQTLMADPEAQLSNVSVILKASGRAVLSGQVKDPAALGKFTSAKNAALVKRFNVLLPFVDSPMLEEWNKRGFGYSFEQEKMNGTDILINILPWALTIGFLIFMMRQMQAGQKGVFSFGKSRAKLHMIDRPKNTFADAAGVDEAKMELEEIIEFLKDPQKFKKLGGKIPKGVLLLGPPGTGKTLLARCVAGEAGVPFLSMSGSDFVEMFVGVGASRVRDLFDTAKKNAPSIIFIDEIDAVGRQRGAGLGGGHDEREQTLNQMLVEMDGFEENSGVILIAATNRPDVLDPALLRAGRFDRQIVVDVPDVKGREGILKVHTKKTPMGPDVDLNTIARGTPGFVGADLANLVNEAALMAARFGQDVINMLDFEEAKDKVLMGVERKSMVLSEKEKKMTAYHEAGHAICNIHCPEADQLHKVTIIPRGRALGVTFSLPGEDKHSYTKEYLLDEICILMAGRMAEELVFGNQTTGASNDIKQATKIVRKIICDYGMTVELGPLSYGEKDEQIFLGREIGRHRDFSDKTAEAIDDLMHKIVYEQMERCRILLTENRIEVDRLANALLEHEMLDREEILMVIKGETLLSAKKTRSLTSRTPAVPPAADGAKPVEPPNDGEKKAAADVLDKAALDASPPKSDPQNKPNPQAEGPGA